MKKLISVLLLFSLAVFVIGFTNNSSYAGNFDPVEGHSYKIIQSVPGFSKKQTVIVNVDKNGNFYKEVISGPDKGNFEVWSGDEFFRFMKEPNDLMVITSKEHSDVPVLSHEFLSESTSEQIIKDINNGQLKKALLKPSEYEKSTRMDKGMRKEKITIDKNFNRPAKYVLEFEEKEEVYFEIIEVKDFIDTINANDFVNIEEIRENGGTITEIEN
ncbi:hypothetical protein [Paenisporosarcina sp. TG20]|uniref:hypothetical protein n=1 Tax=Paenisporosarcina sp. TG20 TaxID=1211706 RepID=UPI00031B4FE7|nr:hypothetical protein [Paenisporosarcina sp. TG20]